MPTLTAYTIVNNQQWPLVEYTYSVSSTNTTTTVTGTPPVVQTSGVSVRVVVDGTEIWNEVDGTRYVTTNTKSFTRTTSAQSKEIKLIVVDFDGTQTPTGTISVPALASYTISYNANGHGTAPSSQTKYYGTNITLRAGITATGYSFKRWNTNSTDTGTAYNASATYSANAAATLYAIWNRTITYNANGGTSPPAAQTAIATSAITITTSAPTYTGFTFKDWNTKTDGTGTTYASGGSYAANNASITLYARWNHTVSFNANGGSGAPSAQTALKTSAITISSTQPTLSGYTFKDWNTKSDGTGTTYASGGSFAANTVNTTLYARWNRTVTYNANGGSGAPSAQTDLKTTAITLSSTQPTLTGYSFKDWNTNSSGTGTTYASGGSYPANNASVTLYARWNRTVTYNANGGSGAPSAQTELKTNALTLSSTIPTRSGYRFRIWNTAADGSGTDYATGGNYAANNPNVILYAQWDKLITSVTLGNVTAIRTDDVSMLPDAEPVETDEGEYVYIKAPYTVEGPAAAAAGGSGVEMTVSVESDSGTDPTITRVVYQASKQEDTTLNGVFSAVAGVCNTDIRYTFTVNVTATNSSVYQTAVIATKTIITPTAFYTIDVKAGGHGIHFGGAAVNNGFWVSMPASFNNSVSAIDNTIDLSVTPATDYYGTDPAFYLKDKNDDTLGYFTPLALVDEDGMYGIQLGTHRNINGTDYWHSIWLGIKSDGTNFVSVGDPAGWRNAINAVNKAGDTMTGGLTFSKGHSVSLNSDSINSTLGVTRSANVYYGGIYSYDNQNTRVYYSEQCATANGGVYRSFVVSAKNSGGTVYYNGFYLNIDSSGNPTVTFNNNTVRDAWATGLNVVKKAGDTMSGILTISRADTVDSGMVAQRTNITNGRVLFGYGSSNNHGIYSYQAAKWVFQVASDNKVYVNGMNFTDAASARTAIGAVNKAGDTMTGALTISRSSSSSFVYKVTGVDGRIGQTAPASNVYYDGAWIVDKNDRLIYYQEGAWRTDNSYSMGFGLRRHAASGSTYYTNGFSLAIDNSGVSSVSVTAPAAWRVALGAASNGVWGIAIGGTGTTTGIKGWTQIAQVQGTNSATYSSSGYTEFLLMIWNSTSYMGTTLVPPGALGSTQYEIYTGGWGNNSSTSNRAACAKVSNAKLTGVMVRVNNSDVTSSSYFRLYAR